MTIALPSLRVCVAKISPLQYLFVCNATLADGEPALVRYRERYPDLAQATLHPRLVQLAGALVRLPEVADDEVLFTSASVLVTRGPGASTQQFVVATTQAMGAHFNVPPYEVTVELCDHGLTFDLPQYLSIAPSEDPFFVRELEEETREYFAALVLAYNGR